MLPNNIIKIIIKIIMLMILQMLMYLYYFCFFFFILFFYISPSYVGVRLNESECEGRIFFYTRIESSVE